MEQTNNQKLPKRRTKSVPKTRIRKSKKYQEGKPKNNLKEEPIKEQKVPKRMTKKYQQGEAKKKSPRIRIKKEPTSRTKKILKEN